MGIMLRFWTLTSIAFAVAVPPGQVPLRPDSDSQIPDNVVDVSKRRPLHGRFLHITGQLELQTYKRCDAEYPQISTRIDSTNSTPRPRKMTPVTAGKGRLASMERR